MIRFAPPELMLAPGRGIDADYARALADCLNPKFGEPGPRWTIEIGDGIAAPSLLDRARAHEDSPRPPLQSAPMVKAVHAHFPEATLLDDPRSSPPWT